MLKPTAGSVLLEGHDITGQSPNRLFAQGLARTFQIPRPFRRMSVLENVMLAPARPMGESIHRPILSPKAMRAQEAEIATAPWTF